MKKRVITFIMLVLAIGTLLTGCVREETEVRDFYISEGKGILNQETYYILTSSDLRCKATEPDLIMYCKKHVGEIVSIKVKITYDNRDRCENVEFINIEE